MKKTNGRKVTQEASLPVRVGGVALDIIRREAKANAMTPRVAAECIITQWEEAQAAARANDAAGAKARRADARAARTEAKGGAQ